MSEVLDAVEIAVDIVPRTRFVQGAAAQLARRHCSPEEQAEVAGLNEPARQAFLAAIWAGKECGIKLAGRRPDSGLRGLVVSLDGRVPHPRLRRPLAGVVRDLAGSIAPNEAHRTTFGRVAGVDGGEATLAVSSTTSYAVAVAARPLLNRPGR